MREPARGVSRAQVRGGWLGWMIAMALLPPGWLFIAHAHRWHLTPSVIVLCLAWTALVGVGLTLVRAANATIDPVTDDWFAEAGSRDELEREKRILIRAIKDIEFDRDTGKLTAADAVMLTATYRGRAIDVIKALELDAIAATPRARILVELEARAQLERTAARGSKAGSKAAKAKARQAAAVATPVVVAAPIVVEPSTEETVAPREEAPGAGSLASREGLATNPPNSTVAAAAASEEVAS